MDIHNSFSVNIHLITAEIDLQATPAQLHCAIEEELQKQGEPLRWAITHVDVKRHKAIVEAVVTLDSK